MSKIVPPSRPQQSLAEIERIIAAHRSSLHADDVVVVVGIRGYYRRTMGDPRWNDRGIYDDAFFIVAPGHFSSYNGNVDPGAHRSGIASLVEGVHRYKPGLHGVSFNRPGYPIPAFIPAAPGKVVPVTRDGQTGTKKGVALNMHPGGWSSVSSLGCQTLPPNQWPLYRDTLNELLRRFDQKEFPYLLVKN